MIQMMRLPPASQASLAFRDATLGLTPQALRWRPLRGLKHLNQNTYAMALQSHHGWSIFRLYRPRDFGRDATFSDGTFRLRAYRM